MSSVSIDIDGVIAKHVIPPKHIRFLKFINQRYQLKKKYSIIEIFIHQLISKPKRPIPEAIRAMEALQQQSYTIILNSARPRFLEETTYNWLKKHGMAGYVHGLRLRHEDIDPIDAKISTIREGQINIHFDDDPIVVEELLADATIQRVFFINTDRDARSKFQDNPKVVCADTLEEAVQYLLRYGHG